MGGQVDLPSLYQKADYWMDHQWGRELGEWGYQDVERRLLVEEMLLVDGKPIREEYKFHISCGHTAYVLAKRINSRNSKETIVLDRDGRVTGLATGKPLSSKFFISQNFLRMREIAETLAEPFDFIRCDLYPVENEIYFSELTVYPSSGYGYIRNKHLRNLRNELWDIRKSWFLRTPQRGWRRLYAGALLRTLNNRAGLYEIGHKQRRGPSNTPGP